MLRIFYKNIIGFFYSSLAKNSCRSYESLNAYGYTKLSKATELGKNVNFNGFKVLGSGPVTIGDNFHSGSGCSIITQVHNYEGNKIPYDNTYIVHSTEIGDNVWLGNNVTILGGVKIGEGCIIQAGSVVVSDLEPLSIAGGHPAKKFKERDGEHYFKLKKEGRFH